MEINGLLESRYKAIIKVLVSISKREGIINPKFEIIKGCEKGDGYAGEKNIAILRGDNKCMEVFIKGAPTNEAYKKNFDPRDIYLLEIFFYEEILPTFLKFQQTKSIPIPFTSIIECVATSSEVNDEILMLQNAKKLGYHMWDRMKQMGREHVEFVFTQYGKFHALSYALKDQQPDVYRGLINKFPVDAFDSLVDTMLDGFLSMAQTSKLYFDPIKEVDVYKPYEKFVDEFSAFMKSIAVQRDEYSVIAHGDCWCTNMMFKYEEGSTSDSRPKDMILLDFQLIREGSPVLDLAYFMYCSSSKEVYNNLDHYLRIYHESLSNTISDLGSDPEVLLPFKELKNQWKKYSKFGLMMGVLNLKACVQEADETFDLAESLEQGEGMLDGFTKPGKNDALYQQRLKDVIEHMARNNFL